MSTEQTIEIKVERIDGDETQLLATLECGGQKIRAHLRKPDGTAFSGSDMLDLGLRKSKFAELLSAAAERGDFEELVGEVWLKGTPGTEAGSHAATTEAAR